MTTYTTIPNGDIDQDSPVTQPLMTAMRDNPIAIAEGSDDAPVVAAGWHPYDMVSIGDGNDGVIYDFSVDGAVSAIETPDWEDGYEYALLLVDMQSSGGGGVLYEVYLSVSAGYSTYFTSSNIGSGSTSVFGFVEFLHPRILSKGHAMNAGDLMESGSSLGVPLGGYFTGAANKYDKARVRLNAGTFSAGKIYMFRRRDPLTG